LGYSLFPGDITIPKLLQDASGRTLSFGEALADISSEYQPRVRRTGLRHIDNTPQEIAELGVEMMDRARRKIRRDQTTPNCRRSFAP
jgi:hypothetical protein